MLGGPKDPPTRRWPGIARKRHSDNANSSGPTFAHESEREFAHLLDFYQIKWQYEPTTFSLQRDADGRVIESFTPDFYLPELDLYIELTTMKQSLVTKKNRKLRHLREMYPEINIKLLYRRDYRSLMLKYGLAPDALGVAESEAQTQEGAPLAAEPTDTATPGAEEKLSPE